ncbi:hypothetical protein DL96DRAFT_1606507 [Flagelloscypha sp. PMI_526]|nr:hypothetical protein DL96DRAFT_1606507 [Flagelloscypha sp. PMI_526]
MNRLRRRYQRSSLSRILRRLPQPFRTQEELENQVFPELDTLQRNTHNMPPLVHAPRSFLGRRTVTFESAGSSEMRPPSSPRRSSLATRLTPNTPNDPRGWHPAETNDISVEFVTEGRHAILPFFHTDCRTTEYLVQIISRIPEIPQSPQNKSKSIIIWRQLCSSDSPRPQSHSLVWIDRVLYEVLIIRALDCQHPPMTTSAPPATIAEPLPQLLPSAPVSQHHLRPCPAPQISISTPEDDPTQLSTEDLPPRPTSPHFNSATQGHSQYWLNQGISTPLSAVTEASERSTEKSHSRQCSSNSESQSEPWDCSESPLALYDITAPVEDSSSNQSRERDSIIATHHAAMDDGDLQASPRLKDSSLVSDMEFSLPSCASNDKRRDVSQMSNNGQHDTKLDQVQPIDSDSPRTFPEGEENVSFCSKPKLSRPFDMSTRESASLEDRPAESSEVGDNRITGARDAVENTDIQPLSRCQSPSHNRLQEPV